MNNLHINESQLFHNSPILKKISYRYICWITIILTSKIYFIGVPCHVEEIWLQMVKTSTNTSKILIYILNIPYIIWGEISQIDFIIIQYPRVFNSWICVVLCKPGKSFFHACQWKVVVIALISLISILFLFHCIAFNEIND